MHDEPCKEFLESEEDEVCGGCGWLERDHKGPAELKKEWMEATAPDAGDVDFMGWIQDLSRVDPIIHHEFKCAIGGHCEIGGYGHK